MSGNSQCMTSQKIRVIVHALVAIPKLGCAHQIANLQFGLLGILGLNARLVVEEANNNRSNNGVVRIITPTVRHN